MSGVVHPNVNAPSADVAKLHRRLREVSMVLEHLRQLEDPSKKLLEDIHTYAAEQVSIRYAITDAKPCKARLVAYSRAVDRLISANVKARDQLLELNLLLEQLNYLLKPAISIPSPEQINLARGPVSF